MPENLCRPHGRKVCSECQHVTDAAKRAYDIVKSYAVFVDYSERINAWVAIRLADGGSDGTLYQSKREAVRHQADEFLCAYFSYRGAPEGFSSPKDAAIWLEYHREAYNHGFRTPDPDAASGGPELIMPAGRELIAAQLGDWRRGLN